MNETTHRRFASGWPCAIATVVLLGCRPTIDAAPPMLAGRSLPDPTSGAVTAPLASYDLRAPRAVWTLPVELREISALAAIDEHRVAGVQDEQGVVFVVDLRDGRVVERMPFGPAGDYEGLACVGDRFWVLRSDGELRELVREDRRLATVARVQLSIGHDDIEGLGHDPFRGVLLVAPKDKPAGDKSMRDRRRVFMVDPRSGRQFVPLALSTSVATICDEAERASIELPEKIGKRGKARVDLTVAFSAVDVHPITGQIYLLSAVDAALLVFDREDRLRAAHVFEGGALPKAEGLTFLPSGDLVIASEGEGVPPRIFVYAYSADAR